jgi:hypothetical protein
MKEMALEASSYELRKEENLSVLETTTTITTLANRFN